MWEVDVQPPRGVPGAVRRAARVDAVQSEIVKALRSVGGKVLHLHQVGGGCPDLLVWGRGRTFLVEVKSPGEQINKLQAEFIAAWPGEIHVVNSPEQAVKALVGG